MPLRMRSKNYTNKGRNQDTQRRRNIQIYRGGQVEGIGVVQFQLVRKKAPCFFISMAFYPTQS